MCYTEYGDVHKVSEGCNHDLVLSKDNLLAKNSIVMIYCLNESNFCRKFVLGKMKYFNQSLEKKNEELLVDIISIVSCFNIYKSLYMLPETFFSRLTFDTLRYENFSSYSASPVA